MASRTKEQKQIYDGIFMQYSNKTRFPQPGSAIMGITGFTGIGTRPLADSIAKNFSVRGLDAVVYDPSWRLDREKFEANGCLASKEDYVDFERVRDDLLSLREGRSIDICLEDTLHVPSASLVVVPATYVGNVIGQLDGLIFLYAEPSELSSAVLRKETSHYANNYAAMASKGMRFLPLDYQDPNRPKLIDTHLPFMSQKEMA